MPLSRNPRSVYDLLLSLDEAGRNTWASSVRNLLERYGFNHVWLSQGVGNEELFLVTFEQRVKDCYLQEWSNDMNISSRLSTYNCMKNIFEMETYVSLEIPHVFKHALSRLRCSNHRLMIEVGRHISVDRRFRVCPLCCDHLTVEDEYHFVMVCPHYNHLRNMFLPSWYWVEPNFNKFVMLMKIQEPVLMMRLAKFVYYANKVRELATSGVGL